MGNCSAICSKNITKIKGDIFLREKNDEKRKISTYDINKLISLQKK